MKSKICKAKRKDNKEWVEGFYFCMVHDDKRHEHHFIIPIGADLSKGTPIEQIQVEIDIETLCDDTGLTDKNGRKIWENDIVRTQEYSDKPYAKNRKTKRHIGVVEYDIGKGSGFYNEETETHDKYREYSAEWSVKIKDYGIYCCGNWGDFFDCEVIGNVFDNPELLEKER